MKKITILILLLIVAANIYSQQKPFNDQFNYQVRQAVGDLNNDGLMDEVTIAMDTISSSKPFKIDIFFSQPNGQSKLFFSSTEIVEAMYPIEKNGEHNGSQVPDVSIEDGKLQLDFYIKGNSRYEFIYKKGEFELIHFSHVHSDGKAITETEFNLLTGKYTKQTEVYRTSEIILNIKKEELITPLPLLKDFKPFENELY